VTDELQLHWTLHVIDEEAAVHEGERAKLPPLRRAAETRTATERKKLLALDARAATLLARRRELERDIAAFEAQEKKYRAQLDAVTDQKQFEAVQHEIAGVAGKRSVLETEALGIMEEEETATADRPAAEAALAKAEREGAETIAKLDASETHLAGLLAALDARRATAVAGLEASSRTRYERARALRGGRAVAELVLSTSGGATTAACGGCFGGQAPRVLQEARKREQLMACDGCGRLLMLPPE
jgi:hypothetical protein